MNNYSVIEQLLHRLVLGSTAAADFVADLECSVYKDVRARQDAIYITGLARAGTTAVLRALHASQVFASLTYRDMPFVLAPNLWRRLTAFNAGKPWTRERAHGDGIVEDADSPEGLEEVFWRIELGQEYIKQDRLLSHDVPLRTVDRLKFYQSLVCNRYGRSRYLAKNNNLILRLHDLAPKTPDTCYLVLFRDPLAQTGSLLRQHLKFRDTRGFHGDYMQWLVHYEFGATHRPFCFAGSARSKLCAETVDYWLERWIEAYSFLVSVLRSNPRNTIAVSYEELCGNYRYRHKLFERLGISTSGVDLKNKNPLVRVGASAGLVKRAESVHAELCKLVSI